MSMKHYHSSQRWKQYKGPLMDKQISTMWYIHIVECYSSLTRKDVVTHAMTWMGLEYIILGEVSQTQKDKLYDSIYMKYLEQSNS